jgi:hypothetical protein
MMDLAWLKAVYVADGMISHSDQVSVAVGVVE